MYQFFEKTKKIVDDSINYDDEFWRKFSSSLYEVLVLLIQTVQKLNCHEDTYRSGLLHLRIFCNYPEYGYRNLSVNLINTQYSYIDLYEFTTKGLEMSFYIQNA